MKEEPAVEPKKGFHIFDATRMTELAEQWKEAKARGDTQKDLELLEQLIIGATQMFERLAQHEHFHYTVDIETLKAAARVRVEHWISKWDPKKGRLFSFLSKCAKNAFRSEVVRVNQYRQRFHVTGDNLEKFFGSEDHTIDREEVKDDVRSIIDGVAVRWGRFQEADAVRFILHCVISSEHSKQRTLRSVTYCYGLTPEMTKFFYDWALMALRERMIERIRVPFTRQDLIRSKMTYTFLPDFIDVVGWDATKKILALFGGTKIKFPTLAQLEQLHQQSLIAHEIDRSDLDPAAIADIAKRHRKTTKAAHEIYAEMAEVHDPNRLGEHFFDDPELT